MVRAPVLPKLVWTCAVCLLLLSSAAAARADGVLVQQIGDLSGDIADAVVAEVTVVPFSPRLDARTTPIILATGKAYIRRDGKRVAGLRPAERRTIQRAYDAGQPIMLLDASTHAVEALHLLLGDGASQIDHPSGRPGLCPAQGERSGHGQAGDPDLADGRAGLEPGGRHRGRRVDQPTGSPWQVDLATSTSNLWTWEFLNLPNNGNTGPTGYCNQFGCSCGIQAASATTTVAHTFKVPIPATQCPS